MESWFTVEEIDRETFVISEYKHWEETHCYLVPTEWLEHLEILEK